MQNRFDLLVVDVMPIYMIMPRYSHNYALFYSCSIVICSPTIEFAILRESTSETYGPRVYFTSYNFTIYNSSLLFILFCNLYFSIYIIKMQKYLSYLIISIRSHFASGREGNDNPFIVLVVRFFFVCVGVLRLELALVFLEEERVMQQ